MTQNKTAKERAQELVAEWNRTTARSPSVVYTHDVAVLIESFTEVLQETKALAEAPLLDRIAKLEENLAFRMRVVEQGCEEEERLEKRIAELEEMLRVATSALESCANQYGHYLAARPEAENSKEEQTLDHYIQATLVTNTIARKALARLKPQAKEPV